MCPFERVAVSDGSMKLISFMLFSPLFQKCVVSVQKRVVQRQINFYIGGAVFTASELVLRNVGSGEGSLLPFLLRHVSGVLF